MHNGAIFHASDSLLQKLDKVQENFLRELKITEEDAYMEFNLAPLKLRRNIGILGLMHKSVLGESHPIFAKLLPFSAAPGQWIRPDGHNKQLYDHFHEVRFQLGMQFRSIFGMVYVYNGLPQSIVDARSVAAFQKELSIRSRNSCATGIVNWKNMYSCRDR